MYNPFKPHIVELYSGKFAVRKLTTTGWDYFDNQKRYRDYFWWTVPEYQHKHCYVDTLVEAESIFEFSKVKPVEGSKVLKVYQ